MGGSGGWKWWVEVVGGSGGRCTDTLLYLVVVVGCFVVLLCSSLFFFVLLCSLFFVLSFFFFFLRLHLLHLLLLQHPQINWTPVRWKRLTMCWNIWSEGQPWLHWNKVSPRHTRHTRRWTPQKNLLWAMLHPLCVRHKRCR